jgi:hypothetical protein
MEYLMKDLDINETAAEVIADFLPEESIRICDLIISAIIADEEAYKWRDELAELFASIPFGETSDPDSALNKHFAVAVAEELGPDMAQQLYRFAVLVTKIAGMR